jgi:hypothetical protein
MNPYELIQINTTDELILFFMNAYTNLDKYNSIYTRNNETSTLRNNDTVTTQVTTKLVRYVINLYTFICRYMNLYVFF